MSLPFLESTDFVVLKCWSKGDARRIFKRCLYKEWWVMAFYKDRSPHLAVSRDLDIEHDIRARLSDIHFEVLL